MTSNNKIHIYNSTNELRVDFIDNLQKLTNQNTKQTSFNKLKQIIENNSSQNALRIYLNSLMTFYQSTISLQAKELIIILYGYLANIYRNNLQDPLDHPPNLTKTVDRIVTHIRNYCLKEPAYTIHKACSYSIIELLDLCIDKKNSNLIYNMFFHPFLLSITNNVNKYARDGCCVYINDLLFHITSKHDLFDIQSLFEILIIKNKYIDTICKINTYDNQFLYQSIYNLLSFFPFEYFISSVTMITNKMISIIISYTKDNKSYYFMTAMYCVNVLGLIGKRMKERNDFVENIDSIINALRGVVNDKNTKVRTAARSAVKYWDDIQRERFMNGNNAIRKEDTIKFVKDIRNRTKDGKVQEFGQYDSELIEKNRKEIYDKGITGLLNVSKFIKSYTKMGENINTNEQQRYYDNTNYNNNYDVITKYNNNEQIKTTVIETDNVRNVNVFFQLINLNVIKNAFSALNKTHLSFEKELTSKLIKTENKLEQINNAIIKNKTTIINNYNNILDDTQIGDENYSEAPTEKYSTLMTQNENDDLIPQYLQCVSLLNKGHINEAFHNLFLCGDDIYLIRVLMLYKHLLGQLVVQLNNAMKVKVILRVTKIVRGHFIENLLFQLIDDLKEKYNKRNMEFILKDKRFVNEVLETLGNYKKYKNNAIANKASSLYNLILNFNI